MAPIAVNTRNRKHDDTWSNGGPLYVKEIQESSSEGACYGSADENMYQTGVKVYVMLAQVRVCVQPQNVIWEG